LCDSALTWVHALPFQQYATAQIEHQITQLRDLIVKLNHGELDLAGAVPGQHLAHIKGDVVNTIRGVVDVVGKYAGGALPTGARNKVKEFILSLPARWATVNRTTAVGPSSSPYFGGSPASPSFSPLHATAGSPTSELMTRTRNPQAAHAAAAANKVLTLAVESLDIIRSVTVVFGESLDRADTWMERLRYLGLQRKRQHDATVGRIEMGAAGDWERAGAVQRARAGSPDAFSDISMASGSSKRRKTRARGSKRGGSRAAATPDSASEDGNNTETDRHGESSGYHSPEVFMSRSNSHAEGSATFVPGSAAGAPVAGSSTAYAHGAAGTSAHRRKTRAKPSNRSRPPSVPGTPNYPSNSLHGD
jgi:transcriptional repressor OPI1